MGQEALFYGFSLEGPVPPDHMLRAIDRFVDLGDIRERLWPFYSDMVRPSIDPELDAADVDRRLCDGLAQTLAAEQSKAELPAPDRPPKDHGRGR